MNDWIKSVKKIEELQVEISNLKEEKHSLEIRLRKQIKSRENLAAEIERNEEKMKVVSEMEKKIEKYEFVLNIDKYRKVHWTSLY